MSEFNDRARTAGQDGRPPRETLCQRLARLCAAWQDRVWAADEKYAADRGWTSQRSASGWSIRVRDPRFDLRQECWECGGTGFHRITGARCDTCGGTGVVTLAEEPEDEPDDFDDELDDDGGESS